MTQIQTPSIAGSIAGWYRSATTIAKNLPLKIFLCFGIFIFSPKNYWYNIGIKYNSVGSTSVILVCAAVGQYLTWAAGFLKNCAGKFDGCSWSSSLGYVGQLLKASEWLADRTSGYN